MRSGSAVLSLVVGAGWWLLVAAQPLLAQSAAAVSTRSVAESHAEILLTVGQYRAALREFETIRAADTSASIPWLGMGRAQEGLKRPRDAVRSYEEYTKREPRDGGGFELLGRALAEVGRQADAVSAYRNARRVDSSSPTGALGLAASLQALGNKEEALHVLRETTRTHPEVAALWGQLAVISLQLDNDIEALSYWQEALRRDPDYFVERSAERTDWARLTDHLRSPPPRADIAVSAESQTKNQRADSGTGRDVRNDSSAVVASPSYPRFARASRSTTFVPGPSSSGSGFVVSRESGFVLTNKHVVRACGQVKVRVDDGKSRTAVVQAIDPDDDLALLRVSLPAGPSAAFRDDPVIRPGDDVVAVGFPLAGLLADQVNVSTGTVNAMAGLYNDLHLLQMSAPVQPGSSGGALFDASGHVVGVVVTKLNARVVAEETGDIPQNVNFAVKGSVAREFLRQHGVQFRTAPSSSPRSNADVGDIGRAVTLLVECWP